MVRRHVRIYVEGGARGRTADSDFRRGWKKFLNDIHETARNHGYQSLEIVRGTGRANTYRRFINYKNEFPNDLCVLLVDSEMLVSANTKVWDVVRNRPQDNWVRPAWATEKHLYLMVSFVETWLLTDQNALKEFFKRGFNPTPLPTTNLESRSKRDIEQALENATKNSQKGAYKHGQAHEIIEKVDPTNVKALHHGKRLFDCLSELITGIVDPQTNC